MVITRRSYATVLQADVAKQKLVFAWSVLAIKLFDLHSASQLHMVNECMSRTVLFDSLRQYEK